MQQDLLYWVWLSSIPGIGGRRYSQLLEAYGDPYKVWNADKLSLKEQSFLGDVTIKKLLDDGLRIKAEEHLRNINNLGVEVIHINHPDYPNYLREIYDPPIVIYSKGKLKQEKSIAIVGSRKASSYGLSTAKKLSYDLAKHGITVISGLARGVDSYAHAGALEAGGRTIAVLGCGVDVPYPPENRNLRDKIINNGAVISEFLPGFPPIPQNFPSRNRIISGISQGVVVIEANDKSGSLITASFALEQGRDVFAVPGNVNSLNSLGTNKLIKDGAKLVTCVEDILEELNYHDIINNEIKTSTKCIKKIDYSILNNEEKILVRALEVEELHIDLLSEKCGLNVQDVSSLLFMLELKGLIEQSPGKNFKLAY